MEDIDYDALRATAVAGPEVRRHAPRGTRSLYGQWGPAWLTYNGPRLIKCLGVPWVQLLFSDGTITDALKAQRARGTWPADYVDDKLADFHAMGRVTRRRLRKAAIGAGFTVVEESSRSHHPVKHNCRERLRSTSCSPAPSGSPFAADGQVACASLRELVGWPG
jgi:hypothetical protein